MPSYYDKDGSPITMEQRVAKFTDEYKRVDRTEFGDKFNTRVSTVWLGLDHRTCGEEGDNPPIIFETMVFSDNKALDGDMFRYSDLKDAKRGHVTMCHHVKKVLLANEE